MTNAQKLAAIGGGGTNCSAPLKSLNRKKAKGDLIFMVSDNQSWMDNRRSGATELMREWSIFRRCNPAAKMVCLDIQPYGTLQATDRDDILNIGGFSDRIFSVVSSFVDGSLSSDHWIGAIEAASFE